jgi:tol-pal system protein YbgF
VLRVEERLTAVGGEVTAVDSLLQAESIASRHKWSGMAADGEGIAQRMQQLQARMDDIVQRLADVRQEVEAIRVYGIGKGSSTPAPPPGKVTAGSIAGTPLVADPQALYDLAMGTRKSAEATRNPADFRQAASEFGQFLEAFPGDELADNALYWQGECHYALKDYPQATAAFERLLKEYPTGDKVAAATLKLGFALVEQKQKKAAIQRLREVVQQFPNSDEAALAKARLKELGAGSTARSRR